MLSLLPGSLGTYHDYMYTTLAIYITNLIKFVKMKLCKFDSFFRESAWCYRTVWDLNSEIRSDILCEISYL